MLTCVSLGHWPGFSHFIPSAFNLKSPVDSGHNQEICSSPVWHQQRRMLEGSLWFVQVNDLTFEGKCQPDGKLNTSRAVVQLCLVPFVKFSKTLFLNSCHPPPPFTPPSLHPRWADRLFRSEEPIWNTVIGIDRNSTADRVQSTLCQWNTNTHCGVGFAVWGSRRPVLTLSDGPLFLTGLSQTVTAERRHVWS